MKKRLTKKSRLIYSSENSDCSDLSDKENQVKNSRSFLRDSVNLKQNYRKANGSQLTPQKKNLDAGDLHISILDENKSKELMNFTYKSQPKICNILSLIKNNQNVSQKFEKEYKGTIKIKIFEDMLGKRKYECVLDFPDNTNMKMNQARNEFYFNSGTSECFGKLNCQKTNNHFLKNCSKNILSLEHQNKIFNKKTKSNFFSYFFD
jgi:hypothetical protein